MPDEIRIEEGSGNVFAGLGLSNSEERLAKTDLVLWIAESIRARKLTETKAAKLFGIDQPKILRLLRGQLAGFSTNKLIRFLTLLGQDVVIVVRPTEPDSARSDRVIVIAEAAVSP